MKVRREEGGWEERVVEMHLEKLSLSLSLSHTHTHTHTHTRPDSEKVKTQGAESLLSPLP